jgi:hypothetical protein
MEVTLIRFLARELSSVHQRTNLTAMTAPLSAALAKASRIISNAVQVQNFRVTTINFLHAQVLLFRALEAVYIHGKVVRQVVPVVVVADLL